MKRKIFTSLAVAGLLACTITATAAAAPLCSQTANQSCTSAETAATMSQLEQLACQLVNEQRATHGLSPLTIDSTLSSMARIKSRDMKNNGYFSHNSPVYGSPFQMMKQLGITYRSAGENIAMGYRSAEAVVQAWMASESHRNNILSDRYSMMGIGYIDGYWTQWLIR